MLSVCSLEMLGFVEHEGECELVGLNVEQASGGMKDVEDREERS